MHVMTWISSDPKPNPVETGVPEMKFHEHTLIGLIQSIIHSTFIHLAFCSLCSLMIHK